jgi:hypothetical protein
MEPFINFCEEFLRTAGPPTVIAVGFFILIGFMMTFPVIFFGGLSIILLIILIVGMLRANHII